MGSGEFVKVDECELKGRNRRGRPLGRWKDRVKEYLGDRGVRGWGVFGVGKDGVLISERSNTHTHTHTHTHS